MVKVSKESLETFQSVLKTVDTSWQTEFNLRETVRQSFELIKKAKQHKVSWEKIAEVLKQSSGVTEGISPESIRQYYFEFLKNPDLLPKKSRKTSQNKKKSKDSTTNSSNSEFASKIEGTETENIQVEQLTSETLKPDIQPVPASTAEVEPERSSSDSQTDSQPATQEPDRKAKDDVRSQFNLGRRGK